MKIPTVMIPILIVLLTVAGLNGSQVFRIPSAESVFRDEIPGTEPVKAIFIIDGVSCRDLALTAMGNLAGLDGVYRASAFASHNRIDVVFNPDATTPEAICKAFHNPVFVEETGEFVFNMFRVIEINGKRIEACASTVKEDGK